VKKAEKDGKKHRYEVDMKLSSEYGLTNINEEGWDLLEVIDEGLNEMNTVIRKEKEKREDRR
jgi:ribosome-associated translation inhibitor RaiA